MVIRLGATKQWVERYQVDSLTGDASYTVSQKFDGTWACSCPAWKFHKAPKPDCKHIESVIMAGLFGDRKPPVPKKRPVEVFAEQFVGEQLVVTKEQMYEFAEKFAESRGSVTVETPSVEVEAATVGEFKITRKFRLNA